ncbi:hypothetical protein BSKO_06956 [Bryopsis sp. KO-2023]|nr:hypothetical protein BSKO_06956 [Bryopsis sp. KO-2023]
MDREVGILALVESGTDANLPATPEETLDQIKRSVRGDEAGTRLVFGILMERLGFQHAQVRLLVVAMMDALFMRSSLFRKLTSSAFQDFLKHSVGYDKDYPLPGPPNRAKALRERALEVVEKWSEKFGKMYKQVDVGHRYLKDVLQFKFPEVGARNARMIAEQAAREERACRLLRAKYHQIVESHEVLFQECEATAKQLNEVLDIIEEQKKAGTGKYDGDDVDWEVEEEEPGGNRSNSVGGGDLDCPGFEEQIGLSAYMCDDIPDELLGISHPEEEAAERDPFETVDAALVENMRGLVKGAFDRLLPTVQEWLRILIRVEVGPLGSFENSRRERLLRDAISKKSSLMECHVRLSELGLPTDPSLYTGGNRPKKEQADDLAGGSHQRKKKRRKKTEKRKLGKGRKRKAREIVDPCAPKPGMPFAIKDFSEPVIGGNRPEPSTATTQQANAASLVDSLPSSNSKLPGELRESLLHQAPRLTDVSKSAFQVQNKAPQPLPSSGTELYNHWGRVDYDGMVPSEKMLDLTSIQASFFTLEKAPGRAGAGEAAPSRRSQQRPSGDRPKLPTEDLGAATRRGLTIKEREKAIREEDRRHNATVLGLSDERLARETAEDGLGHPKKKKKNAKVEKLKKFLFRK